MTPTDTRSSFSSFARSRALWAALISVALHAAGLLVALAPPVALVALVERPTIEASLVEIKTVRQTAAKLLASRARPQRPGRARPLARLGLADLGLSYSWASRPRESKALVKDSVNPRAAAGAAGVFAREEQNSGLYHELYARLAKNTSYPIELSHTFISGSATAELSFSSAADYLESQSTIAASSPYLRVLVARAVRRALAKPLPETMRHPDGPFVIHCQFEFAITEHDDDDLKRAGNSQLGADFRFFRNWQHSKLSWDLGPFHGLFPIPALAFSPGELVESVGRLFSKKSVPDPLQPYRDDPAW